MITDIDITTFEGVIPVGFDLIVYEKGDFEGGNVFVLYGFDEVGMFDSEITNPQYAFYK